MLSLSIFGIDFSSLGAAMIISIISVSLAILVGLFSYKRGVRFGKAHPYPNWKERRDILAKKIVITRLLNKEISDHIHALSLEWEKLDDIVNYREWREEDYRIDRITEDQVEMYLSVKPSKKQPEEPSP